MKILTVDDEEDILYILEAMLKSGGYEVVSAKNGIEALEYLKAAPVDMIISDILMPKMDGIQLCRECKNSDRFRDIPFMFYTGTYTDKQDEEFAMSLGAAHFMLKPAAPEPFLRMVREILDGAKAGRLAAPKTTNKDEPVFLKQYNERLIKKLEDKVVELSDAKLSLESEIAERKKAEEALRKGEKRLRDVTSSLGEGIYVLNVRGHIKFMNPEAERLLGWTIEELNGHPHDMFHNQKADGTPLPLDECMIHNVVKTGKRFFSADEVFIRKDGTVFPVSVISSPIVESGNVVASVTAFRDITELKQAEEAIQASLREKELLLREIHHRVKNNLQIISSLLNIQSRYVKDERSREIFKESRSRVLAIASLHENLYRSQTLSKIDLNDYVRIISAQLLSSYGVKPGVITVARKIGDISFDIDTAIPCGLIINELLSNSIKYAFPDQRSGEVRIELSRNNSNAWTLVVSDNGIGLPVGLDENTTETLGLRLISNLVKQLQGTMSISRERGTRVEITFVERKQEEKI